MQVVSQYTREAQPHTPREHVSPGWHVTPQPPQLLVSEPSVQTHTPPHTREPAPHEHTPELHDAPVGQRMPHAPQLFGSKLVSMQMPPHSVLPVGQRHEPAMHV